LGSVSKWITGVVTAVEDTAGAEERAAIPYRLGMPGPDHSVGVYLHVPFCERVCPYCDFAVVGVRQLEASVEARYVEALLRELDARAALFTGRALATIYFGGGTPSLLQPASVERLQAAVRDRFGSGDGGGVEVSLEVNPSSVERARLPGFREAGVNRISMGIQSFDDGMLKRLGRAHRGEEGLLSWQAAREAGFANLSLDLIFAGPGASPEQLERDLDQLLALGPEHVSTYALTVEDGTPFETALARGQLELPEEDDIADAMERIAERLAACGIDRYEVSSYAREGFASRHNQRYWSRLPVLALGVGAVSSEPASPGAPYGRRSSNHRSLGAYLKAIEAGEPAAPEGEVLAEAVARGEALFLGLRGVAGVAAQAFAAEFGGPPRDFYASEIDDLLEASLLSESEAGDLRLSQRGWLLADSVALHFL
jgi:oxygen-independent coproporphyrinogen-3 oxidase